MSAVSAVSAPCVSQAESVVLNVVLTLGEVHSGTAKVLNVTRSRMCPVCGGLGALPEDLETYVLLCFFSPCVLECIGVLFRVHVRVH